MFDSCCQKLDRAACDRLLVCTEREEPAKAFFVEWVQCGEHRVAEAGARSARPGAATVDAGRFGRVGRHERDDAGCVSCVQIFAHGFELGPIAGHITADLIATGKIDLPIAPFSIGRFGAAGPVDATSAYA